MQTAFNGFLGERVQKSAIFEAISLQEPHVNPFGMTLFAL